MKQQKRFTCGGQNNGKNKSMKIKLGETQKKILSTALLLVILLAMFWPLVIYPFMHSMTRVQFGAWLFFVFLIVMVATYPLTGDERE